MDSCPTEAMDDCGKVNIPNKFMFAIPLYLSLYGDNIPAIVCPCSSSSLLAISSSHYTPINIPSSINEPSLASCKGLFPSQWGLFIPFNAEELRKGLSHLLDQILHMRRCFCISCL